MTNQWGTCLCGTEDYLLNGLCEPCRFEEPSNRPAVEVCGYCRATVPQSAYVRHDIEAHGGLERTREDHRLVCEHPARSTRGCMCRVDEYEGIAASINRAVIVR